MLSRRFGDDQSRWTAVLRREAAADGRFVYAVSSTGIYCRPSCPSRRPGRDRVAFFDSAEQAEAAGYRACRRCTPDRGETEARRRVRSAREYLDRHADETVTLTRLARAVGASPFHLQRSFTRLVGMSPRAYSAEIRMQRMKDGLRRGDSVTRATYRAGYGSPSRAHGEARARLGMTPSDYRRGGEGVRVRYTILPSVAGTLLVAATDRGLCSVALGDSRAALQSALRREYPAATLEPDDAELARWAEAVVRRVEGGGEAEVPLDVRGTAFQRRVWEALRRIPRGSTRTYGEIAREIGRPKAARAVAGACAGNPVAVVVPCHRVVREDGQLGGYRWGIERKRALLAREASR
jgi:AraC family transcriptional regulator of adaptative response/methylated-DNA-[protein]-cysteine methyltransferase